MQINEIKEKLKTEDYDFLRTNEHLGNSVILLGIAGSHAYGLASANSDVDLRGIALNSRREILIGKDFEEFQNAETDSVIWSFNRAVYFLSRCNPHLCELLGLKEEHYIYANPIGKEILNNKKMFLSKEAIKSFGDYALEQTKRLRNKEARTFEQPRKEAHILEAIEQARDRFKDKYLPMDKDYIKLYLDDAVMDDIEKEIFMDINLTHYPFRDHLSMYSEMRSILKQYSQMQKQPLKEVNMKKIGKHMSSTIQSYIMGINILNDGIFKTYLEADEQELIKEIRSGRYVNEQMQVHPDYYDIEKEYKNKFEEAANNTKLPDKPNFERIYRFMEGINEKVVKGEIN